MKIVCISASQVPSDSANSIQVMKVCQAFTQLGHDTTLLVQVNPQSSIADQQLTAHYGLATLFPIEWLPGSRRLFPWIAVRRARALNADLLYAWPVQSAALGLLAGMSVMLEMHDFPAGSFGPLWYRLFLRLPGKKRLLPITHALRRELERRYRPALPDGQVVIAPDGVDLERYEHLPDPESARLQLGLPPGLTVTCTGHLYTGRGADLFLDLAASFPKINFLWVGGRLQEVDEWRGRAATSGLHNVTYTSFLPNEYIPLYQAAADILCMPYERMVSTSSGGNTAGICSPMKMFEYMAAGRAILSSDLAVLREVLNEGSAVFCPPGETGVWEKSLSLLVDDAKQRQALGQRARADVKKYSWLARARSSLENFGC
jgi:glycosyltransferase involved in cell wall biosynthesis